MNYNLQKGDLLTVFTMNGFAMTTQSKIVVDRETETHIVFKKSKRKRKLFQIKKDSIAFLFKGHDLPFVADTEGDCYRGNACFNFVSDMTNEELVSYIEKNAINLMKDDDLGRVLHYTKEQGSNVDYEPDYSNVVYPMLNVHCAPLEHAKSKNRPCESN